MTNKGVRDYETADCVLFLMVGCVQQNTGCVQPCVLVFFPTSPKFSVVYRLCTAFVPKTEKRVHSLDTTHFFCFCVWMCIVQHLKHILYTLVPYNESRVKFVSSAGYCYWSLLHVLKQNCGKTKWYRETVPRCRLEPL